MVAALLSGCPGAGTGIPDGDTVVIQLSESGSIVIGIGQTHLLEATVSPSGTGTSGFEWASSNPAIAAVDQGGLVTALSSGEAQITISDPVSGAVDSVIADCRRWVPLRQLEQSETSSAARGMIYPDLNRLNSKGQLARFTGSDETRFDPGLLTEVTTHTVSMEVWDVFNADLPTLHIASWEEWDDCGYARFYSDIIYDGNSRLYVFWSEHSRTFDDVGVDNDVWEHACRISEYEYPSGVLVGTETIDAMDGAPPGSGPSQGGLAGAMLSDGELVAGWSRKLESTVFQGLYAIRSTGGSWSAPVGFSEDTFIRVDANGDTALIMSDREAVIYDSRTGLTSAVQYTSSPNAALLDTVSDIQPGGAVALAWLDTDFDGPDFGDLMVRMYRSDSGWDAGSNVTDTLGLPEFELSDVATDQSGRCVVSGRVNNHAVLLEYDSVDGWRVGPAGIYVYDESSYSGSGNALFIAPDSYIFGAFEDLQTSSISPYLIGTASVANPDYSLSVIEYGAFDYDLSTLAMLSDGRMVTIAWLLDPITGDAGWRHVFLGYY